MTKGSLRVTVAVLLLSQSFGVASAAHQDSQGHRETEDPIVAAFAVRGVPAIRALLQLSRTGKVPMGIVVGGEEFCRTQVSYSAENKRASAIANEIAVQVPGYTAAPRAGSAMIVAAPVAIAPATSQFLGLLDARYAVKGNVQTLATMLWVHVLAMLHPDQGSAGSILGSTSDRVFGLELTNVSVEQILDRIAMETQGTWVLRPLPPKLEDLGGAPFEIFSEFGRFGSDSGDLCSPIGTAGPK